MTTGIHQLDGTLLSDEAHLCQSIADILTTPLGSHVMRRNYGSRLYELIDAPINRQTTIEFTVATADALLLWEPRVRVCIAPLTTMWLSLLSLRAGPDTH